MEFKDNFKYFRIKQGYSQPSIAKKLGVSTSLINSYEKGHSRPSYELLEAISDLLKVSVDELMGRDANYSSNEVNISYDVLSFAEKIFQNEDLRNAIATIPAAERCKSCTTIQFLCAFIVNNSSL